MAKDYLAKAEEALASFEEAIEGKDEDAAIRAAIRFFGNVSLGILKELRNLRNRPSGIGSGPR
jgi:hypothetical protein